ncbi:FxLYD domain-containing protein [Micromonospora mangrovi]|uniref:FxLYD domain-containing protein n=2 Tax=Micromonospora TaxID=1873 RepID=A0AAU8HP50_9ACTN
METGFGQHDEYVAVVALVENTSEKVGQTVTVQFNVSDAAGTLLKSQSQVESFTRPGAETGRDHAGGP